jgi:CBS domain-containing protein
MASVRQVLDQKGRKVLSIAPDRSVAEAIKLMADNNVGSLLVMEGDRLVGIITERHYARDVFLKGRTSPETRVGDIMTKECVCAHEDATVEECMAVMTAKRVRHLPVVEGERVVGIVSVGDLVKSIISDQKFIIEQLEHYITH